MNFNEIQDILLQFPDKKHPPITKHLIALDGVNESDAYIIAKMLNAPLVHAPPPQIDNWRTQFDAMPAKQRDALYTYGDYLLAQKIVFAGADLVVATGLWFFRAGASTGVWPVDMLRPPRVTGISISADAVNATSVEKRGDINIVYLKRSSYEEMVEEIKTIL